MKVREAIEELGRMDPDDELSVLVLDYDEYTGVPVVGMRRDTSEMKGKTILEPRWTVALLCNPNKKRTGRMQRIRATVRTSKGKQ